MKTQFKKLLVFTILCCLISINVAFGGYEYNSISLFNFDANCIKKYTYEVDKAFILDDNHTAYHVQLDDERKLVLKVMKTEAGFKDINTNLTIVYDCQSVKGLQPNFVVGVNNGSSPVFVKDNGKYYPVSYAEYNVDNESFFSSFAPPHHSFVYEYTNVYNPLETLRPAALDALDYDTRNYYYSTEQERENYQFAYLQMYRDVCANRPYSIVTPRSGFGQENPYKFEDENTNPAITETSFGTKQIYRTCQHPVEVKHIKRIGVSERSYEEDGTTYTSKLVAINGVPLSTYLETHKYNSENTKKGLDLAEPVVWEYDLTKPVVNSKYPPKYIIGSPKLDNNTAKESAKGVENIPKTYNTEVTNTPKNTNNTIVLNVPEIKAEGITHTVEVGETLYSISKKYNISVLNIKIDNQLSENTIEIGQKLIISAN